MDSSDWSVRCRLSIVYNEFGILEYYDRHYLEAIDHLTTCIRFNPRIGAYYLSRARARYMIEVCMSLRIGNSDTSLLVRSTLEFHANYIPLSILSMAHSTLNAGGIQKRNFICTVRPTVHTNPSRKRIFSKTLFKLEEFVNASFSFSCERKIFSKRSSFRKR